MAAVKSAEDKIEAIEAELEFLRIQVKVGGGAMPSEGSSLDHFSSGWYHTKLCTLYDIDCVVTPVNCSVVL